MPMSSTTANWHWKSKSVTPWARTWFENELPTVILTTTDNVTIGVKKVTDVDGDVELGMRKSKLITIFDVKVVLTWTATHPDGTEATGSLSIPEVSHEVIVDGLSDYIFDWSLDKSKSDAPKTATSPQALLELAKKHLPSRLTAKFEEFPKALVDTHGKDLVATPTASGAATPASGASSAPVSAAAVTAAASTTSTPGPERNKAPKKLVNSSTVRVEAQFMVSGQDLFGFLTDEARIPAWSRAPAKSKPVEGADFSLFGGGVIGKYISIDAPQRFVQSWKLKSPTWPDDHEGILTTTLDQQTDSTKLVLELSGVPKGQEDEIERNLTGYYINSLKSIGYVPFNIQSSQSPSTTPRTTAPRREKRHRSRPSSKSSVTSTFYGAALAISFAIVAWTIYSYSS